MTWNEREPAVMPRPPWVNRALGHLRLGLAILMTPVWVLVFLTGKILRAIFGRWVKIHAFADMMWARTGLFLVGLRREVHGQPIASGALVANHSSWSDILVLRSIKWIYFISKADVATWPGVGWLARMVGTVFIERRRVDAKRQEEIVRERIAADQLLCFFPEGTSTDGLRVLPFKSSLFSAFFGPEVGEDLRIQPVSVRYIPNPEAGLPEDFFGWWGTMPFGGHIRAVMQRSFGSRVVVTFHEPVRPMDFKDRKALADHCHRAVDAGHRAASEF